MFKSLFNRRKKKLFYLENETKNKIQDEFFGLCKTGSDVLLEEDLLLFSTKFKKDCIKELKYDIAYYKKMDGLEIENMVKTGRFINLNFINQQIKDRKEKVLNRVEKKYLNELEFKNNKLILRKIYKHFVEIEKRKSKIKLYSELTPEEFNNFIFNSINNGKPVKFKHFMRFMVEKY